MMRLIIFSLAFCATSLAKKCQTTQVSSDYDDATTDADILICVKKGCCGTDSERYCCDSLGGGTIAGISVGSVGGVISLLSIAGLLYRRFCTKKQENKENKENKENNENNENKENKEIKENVAEAVMEIIEACQ